MKTKLFSLLKLTFMFALAACVVTLTISKTSVHADTNKYLYGYGEDIELSYVNSVENYLYPESEKYYTVLNMSGSAKFVITEPTIVKTFVKWDASKVKSASVFYSWDEYGLNVIGKTLTLKASGDSLIHLLDAGTYYLNYSFVNAGKSDEFSIASAGICPIGQKTGSNERVAVSSFTNPNYIYSGMTAYGSLSVTAPIDYYRFNVTENGEGSFTYNFDTYTGLESTKGLITLYDSNKKMLTSKTFNSTKTEDNVLKYTFVPGEYYVTLNGAETSTTLIYNFLKEAEVEEQKRSVRDITVTYVDEIENALYPSTDKFDVAESLSGAKKITLKKPTIIKAYMTWDTTKIKTANTWLSRDADGIDKIGEDTPFRNSSSYMYHLLDPGTYYFNYEVSPVNNKVESATTGVCVLGQKISSTETNYVSSFTKATKMESGKKQKGFLSVAAPVDYYKIVLDESANVTFTFNFANSPISDIKKGTITLYSKSKEFILNRQFSTKGRAENKFVKFLKKGTYYVSMSGAETYTTLKYKAVPTEIKPSQVDHGKTVTISFTSKNSFTQILMVKGNVDSAFKANKEVFNKNLKTNTLLNGKSITVSENGTYTFRFEDVYGNLFLKKVTVKGCG